MDVAPQYIATTLLDNFFYNLTLQSLFLEQLNEQYALLKNDTLKPTPLNHVQWVDSDFENVHNLNIMAPMFNPYNCNPKPIFKICLIWI